MLKIINLKKLYGRNTVIDNISIEFGKGVFGLIGPNGAGKTTFIRILATVVKKDGGQIIYDNARNITEIRRMIGYLPQKFSLYGGLTVREGLSYIALMKEIPSDKMGIEVSRAIKEVNLDEKADERISSLSGGMKRRLGIAQAILGDPEIILVDEPTAGLDPEERIRFRRLIAGIGKEHTIIISTHIVEDVRSICDRIAVMNHGRIIENASYEELLDKYRGHNTGNDTLYSSELERVYMRIIGEDDEKGC